MKTYKKSKKEGSIKKNTKINALVVLDIDSTIIGSVSSESRSGSRPELEPGSNFKNADNVFMGYVSYKRPFADLFIQECFNKFRYVAIWTAGSKKWAENFVYNILKMRKSKFLFVWDQTHCATVVQPDGSIGLSKPLKLIWEAREFKNLGLGRSNIFLIDDRPENGIFNKYNQITIPDFDLSKNDNVLGQMIIYFRKLNWNGDCRETITKIKLRRLIN